jgi:hypothetical protein
MNRCSYEGCTTMAQWWAGGPRACDKHLAEVVRAMDRPHVHLWRAEPDVVTALADVAK